MKIDTLHSLKKNLSSQKKKKIALKHSYSFEDMLQSIIPIDNQNTKDIHILWKELPSIEKQFIDQPNNENLSIYKEYVQSIIRLTLKQNVFIRDINFKQRNDKQAFKIIKIINQDLQTLNYILINKNNSAFNLMKKIRDIRGLLLDIKE